MLLTPWALNAVQPTPTLPFTPSSVEPSTVTTVVSTVTVQPSSMVDPPIFGPFPTDVFAAWGQWVGGLGSILAAVAAFVVLYVARRHQKNDARAHAVDRARTVVARKALVRIDPGWSGPSEAGFRIENHGQGPVLEVMVELVDFITKDGRRHKAWEDNDESKKPYEPYLVADVLAAGADVFYSNYFVADMWDYLKDEQDRDRQPARVWVTFTFLDSEGYRWRRVGTDAPKLIEQSR